MLTLCDKDVIDSQSFFVSESGYITPQHTHTKSILLDVDFLYLPQPMRCVYLFLVTISLIPIWKDVVAAHFGTKNRCRDWPFLPYTRLSI